MFLTINEQVCLLSAMTNIKELSASTPDPERALNNLNSFIKENPKEFDKLSEEDIYRLSMLFAYSQFLANYCIKNPLTLLEILHKTEKSIVKSILKLDIYQLLNVNPNADVYHLFREFKKKTILWITLRNILGMTDISESMLELSYLADILIDAALDSAKENLIQKFGDPDKDSFSILSLGKLGGEELNYSSDVDLICAYENDKGETSGMLSPQGVRINRISNHEFYCKLVESINRLLSSKTEDGFVYRVDLRLRPEGQKGDLALSLGSYELYYESWGREWERLALIRARHVAGDEGLSNEFFTTIKPFVYRKYLDMGSIDEIRRLKTKIDASFKENDIKRGFGGIREIEFFAQTLQLIYGGREQILQENRLLIALHKLQQKNLIGYDDYSSLIRNYLYLRKLEHFLQMLNDLQTYSVPADEHNLRIIAKKMGYNNEEVFINDLKDKRLTIRKIYDSLFKSPKEDISEGSIIFDNDITYEEIRDYLYSINIKDHEKVTDHVRRIKNSLSSFQSLRAKGLQSSVIPKFTEEALKNKNPVMTFKNLERFVDILITNEPYLEIFSHQYNLIKAFIEIFSKSEHLSSIIMGNPRYLDMLTGGMPVRKTLNTMIGELRDNLIGKIVLGETLSIFRKMEEVRLGIMFLNKKISIVHLMKGLSRVAESILACSLKQISPSENVLIVGFGKFGSREITINSDLDITFLTKDTPDSKETKAAERILRILMSYTKEGIAYKVDTRLRPEGSKGPLVNSFSAVMNYYMNKARIWEIQALIRARPVAGNKGLRDEFICLSRDIIKKRGRGASSHDIIQMREKIKKELLKTNESYDIKLGVGGIEDIEFLVQYLQLRNIFDLPLLNIQNTILALKRLMQYSIIDMVAGKKLLENYLFYRTVETFIRLRGEELVIRKDELIEPLSDFLGFDSGNDFKQNLNDRMLETKMIVDKMMG